MEYPSRRHCERSEAIQFFATEENLDCFASLAMTVLTDSPSCMNEHTCATCAPDQLPDGQFAHARHAQFARRANLPQACALAPSGKSRADFRASRLDEEGRYGRSSRNVGRDAVDATVSCAHEVAGRGNS
jgi:hypothetical protein